MEILPRRPDDQAQIIHEDGALGENILAVGPGLVSRIHQIQGLSDAPSPCTLVQRNRDDEARHHRQTGEQGKGAPGRIRPPRSDHKAVEGHGEKGHGHRDLLRQHAEQCGQNRSSLQTQATLPVRLESGEVEEERREEKVYEERLIQADPEGGSLPGRVLLRVGSSTR